MKSENQKYKIVYRQNGRFKTYLENMDRKTAMELKFRVEDEGYKFVELWKQEQPVPKGHG